MVYHRSDGRSGDARGHGRYSRDDDSDGREPRYESKSKDDRYSGRHGRDSRRSRSRDRDDRDSGRNHDKPPSRVGSRFSSAEEGTPQPSSAGYYVNPAYYVGDQTAGYFPHGGLESVSNEEKLQNQFQNDGSFLEMFKKMQQTVVKPEKVESAVSGTDVPGTSGSVAIPKPVTKLPMVGKRRGGRVLKTGMVKKLKKETAEEERPKDAWSMYMNEVRKYKEASCEEEGKTRPLVK